ncbi:Uncharacterised protein [Legionella busanensis]|uniref:Uncharacterized protein n=1 Tax=Legionella busanensis TaxID=190655 RepID=A0A378JHY0_9GAMM|nr:Uncharacterised protein [Legionella busanensis]
MSNEKSIISSVSFYLPTLVGLFKELAKLRDINLDKYLTRFKCKKIILCFDSYSVINSMIGLKSNFQVQTVVLRY